MTGRYRSRTSFCLSDGQCKELHSLFLSLSISSSHLSCLFHRVSKRGEGQYFSNKRLALLILFFAITRILNILHPSFKPRSPICPKPGVRKGLAKNPCSDIPRNYEIWEIRSLSTYLYEMLFIKSSSARPWSWCPGAYFLSYWCDWVMFSLHSPLGANKGDFWAVWRPDHPIVGLLTVSHLA